MKSKSDWRNCELRKSISAFLADYFHGQMLKNIESSIDTLVVYANQQARQEGIEEVWKLLFPDGDWERPTLRPTEFTQLRVKELISERKKEEGLADDEPRAVVSPTRTLYCMMCNQEIEPHRVCKCPERDDGGKLKEERD